MNKEEVFGIMGKYYGNAHYRYCSDAAEHNLLLTVDLLDEINALGYCFSNDQRIVETCDRRFPDILKKYIGRFDDQRFQDNSSRLSHTGSMRNMFRTYWIYTPGIAITERSDLI